MGGGRTHKQSYPNSALSLIVPFQRQGNRGPKGKMSWPKALTEPNSIPALRACWTSPVSSAGFCKRKRGLVLLGSWGEVAQIVPYWAHSTRL